MDPCRLRHHHVPGSVLQLTCAHAYAQELATAVRLRLHVVVLILNDSCYGMIKWKQAGMAFQEYGLDLNNPDFVKYAEAYSAHGHRITQARRAIFWGFQGYCMHAC